MEYIIQFVKYTVSWKIILLNFCIFVFINLYININENLVYFLFFHIPGLITPWIILSNFAHVQIFHFLLNAYWLYLIGSIIEKISWPRILIKLMVFSMIFTIIWISLSPFIYLIFPWQASAVLWFSWILMGMLAFVFFKYKYEIGYLRWQIWILLTINILIWFIPGISLVWHLFWAIGGFIYAKLLQKIGW